MKIIIFALSAFLGSLALVALAIWGMRSWNHNQVVAKVRGDIPLGVFRSALAMDWKSVDKELKAVKPEKVTAPQRLLRGIALIQLSKTNEALKSWEGVDGKGLSKWLSWTSRLETALPDEPVALFLHGDALARVGKYTQAIQSFSKALKLDPDWAAALEARGVSRAASGRIDAAVIDFDSASRSGSAFEDAWSSVGALCIQQRTRADAASSAFSRALKFDAKDVIALNGRGAMRVVTGDLAGAQADLLQAQSLAKGLPRVERCVETNLQALDDAHNHSIRSDLERITGSKPGTEVDRMLAKVTDPRDAARIMGDLRSDNGWTEAWRGGQPDESRSHWNLQISKNPSANVGVDTVSHPLRDSDANIEWRSSLYDALKSKFKNVRPDNPNWLQSAADSHTVDGYRWTHAIEDQSNIGGARTKDIAYAQVDSGHWGVVTLYGLGYASTGEPTAQPAPVASMPRRRGSSRRRR